MNFLPALLLTLIISSVNSEPVNEAAGEKITRNKNPRLNAMLKRMGDESEVTTASRKLQKPFNSDQRATVSRSIISLKGNTIAFDSTETYAIRLSLPSVGFSYGAVTKDDILSQQNSFLLGLGHLSSRIQVIDQTQLVLNAIFAKIQSSNVFNEIINDPNVRRVTTVGNYELELSETIPYIGSSYVQEKLGFDGSGITVAVLDSGVDYTHVNLGGDGVSYWQAYDDFRNRGNFFPTAKVVEGRDFAGEGIGQGPDDNPIDREGHGTSVADVIAGSNGFAPGANILAVKVCVPYNGCPGVPLLMGMEYALEQKVRANREIILKHQSFLPPRLFHLIALFFSKLRLD